MYKLVALDMDGTLLDDKKNISLGNKEAIIEAKKNGCHVIIATGRPKKGIIKYQEQLKTNYLNEYLVVFNGALVIDYNTDEVIYESVLTGKDIHYLNNIAKDLNVNIHAFDYNQRLITPKNSKYTEVEASLNNIDINIENFDNYEINKKIIKIMLIDEPEVLKEAIKKLPKEVYDKYTVVMSAPFFLEFLNKEVDKWNAIKTLGAHLGITKDEIICMGDAGNDLGMIKNAGLGIAMENSFKEVLEEAKYITKNNNEDGVAYAINKFVLNKIE